MEAEGVHRAIAIAEVAEVPLYIVHLSCSDALEEVKRGRAAASTSSPRPARSTSSSTRRSTSGRASKAPSGS
jgi:hypothetical protein